jgi:hypothetical protein
VARLLRLTPAYLSSASQLGLRAGTAVSRDMLGVLRALEGASELELPGADDLMTLRPPRKAGEPHTAIYGRRVSGRNIWVWYRATRSEVELVGATGAPVPPT